MRVTTWAEYGLIVSVHLARRFGEGPVAAREVAEKEYLPADYVEQILLRLRRSGLVASVRGAHGGYMLARPASDISVKDVLDAAEHGTFEVNCDVYPVSAERCGPGGNCTIRPVWRKLQRSIDETLSGILLSDLASDRVRELAGVGAGV